MFELALEGDGIIKDSRRIGIFFERDGLAQRYLRNIKWMVDEGTKEEYKSHLLRKRRRLKKLSYGRSGMGAIEYFDENGLIPQIEETFRNVLIEEAKTELERKISGIRDPLLRKRISENCERCRQEVLNKLGEQFTTYIGLIESEMVDAAPKGIFGYKV